MSRTASFASAALCTALLLAAAPELAEAQARDAARRYQVTQRGDITIVANSLMTCSGGPSGGVSCADARAGIGAARRNNDYTMQRIDSDTDASTFDSSSSDLALPAGAAVTWAGLYWVCQTGDATVPNVARRNIARLRAPGGAYVDRTADRIDTGLAVGGRDAYLAFDDVTTAVQAGGVGTYTVADVQCVNNRTNTWGGWAMIVAYEDTTAPLRDLSVFDAFRTYGTTAINVNITGFLTPATGTVNSRVGMVDVDGDRGNGDTLRLISGARNTLLGETGAAALNPTTDISNSTISRFAANVTTRAPAYQNTLGFDADLFATVDALPNAATSAQIRVQTGGEELLAGVFTFATDVFAPQIDADKSAVDVNGGSLLPGDVIEYTITATNRGADPAINTVMNDVLPVGVDFVPGSLRLGAATLTDAAADDVGEYVAGPRRVTVRLGAGATAVAGGTLAIGATQTVRFRVRIQTTIAAGTRLSNQASVTYAGATLGAGTTYVSDTDGDPTTGGPQPTDTTVAAVCGDNVITAPETCDGGNAVAGDGCGVTCRREVVITTPADGAATNDATPTISGVADPGATVVVSIDGATAATVTATATGTWTFTPATVLADGAHTIAARATDTATNITNDAATITVDTMIAVAISTPADGSASMNATPTISGTAEPGAMVSVAVDGTVLGTVTASAAGTWSIDVTTPLAEGTHTAAAVAMDAAGNMATAMTTFSVDTMTTVAITSPSDGAMLIDGTPTIRGTAEAGATVTVTIDGIVVGMAVADGSGAWSVTPTTALADGPHSVVATAVDGAGNTAMDAVDVTLMADTSTTVTIDRPADGAVTGDTTPLLSGTAEPGASVAITIDGVLVATVTADAAGAWFYVPSTALAAGPHTVSVIATDSVDNTATDTTTFTVDTSIPSLTLVAPGDGTITAERRPVVSGTADPGAFVVVIVDGVTVGTVRTDADGTWSIPVASDLADGPHTATATTTNASGATATESNDFTVDSTAPSIVITTPVDGSVIGTATPAISGNAEPGATVEVRVDGALVGTATAAADGTWSVTPTTPLAAGSHIVVATASDADGNVATDSGTFTVDLETRVAITSPADGGVTGTATPTIGGTAEPGAMVAVSVDGTVIGTVTAGPDGRWSITVTTALSDGAHAVSVTATDGVGNTATDTSTFTVDRTIGDRDGDGVPDTVECPGAVVPCPDTDGDGTPDIDDTDDDGDGLPTVDERPGGGDVDTDGDGTPDYLDPDDDGDGVPTLMEAPGGVPRDTDLDGRPDHLDTDDDGDGLPTRTERPSDVDVDTDGDTTPDYLDGDDDDDGIPTARERADGTMFGNDVDGDGMPNWLDTESDGDGALDETEGLGDVDGDGVPNYLDPDGVVVMDGGVLDGSVADGSVADGSVADGSVADGSVADGSVRDGGAGDGSTRLTDGALVGGACGCTVPGSSGRSSGGGLALFGFAAFAALALRRRRRAMAALVLGVACAAIALPSAASAQAGGFTLNQFHAAETVTDGFAVSRPLTPGHLVLSAQLVADYANDPLVFESRAGDADSETTSVVSNQLVGTLAVALGLGERVAVYGQLPVSLWMDGDALGGVPGTSGATPGDPVIGGRVRLFGEAADVFKLGVQLGVSLPLAEAARADQAYVGEGGVMLLPRLSGEFRLGDRARLTLNAGARLRRETDLQILTVGNELTLGAGLGVDLIPNRLELLAEIYGATGFTDFFARGTSPFEVLGGLRARPVCALVIGLAAGTGVSRGYGSPDVRAVLQIGISTATCEVAPVAEPIVEVAPVDTDTDDDGILDPADGCPTVAEDRDEWEDADGCPDPDNDGDQVLDVNDGAPNIPEDRDNFEDSDGVPDPDNDADQVLDADDGAPLDPEDRDGFQDADGVPDPDNDADTVLDTDDQCPLDPGTPAARGCPVTIRVDRETGTIFILQRVEFATSRDVILDRSFPILEEVRAVLASNPALERLRIEGHTDDRGRDAANLDLSRRRAASVVRWLVEHGVTGARLEGWGCGELHPAEPNRTSAGRQSNRRVEFHIVTPAPANGARAPEGCVQAE